MELKNNKNNLYDAMEKYAETLDSDLITEEVYNQYVRFIQHISIKTGMFDEMSVDDKVSIVNKYMWKRIKNFDKTKASMGTFLSVVIKTAFLMEIRINNELKNKCHTDSVSLDDIILNNDAYESYTTRYAYEGKEDERLTVFEYNDLFNKALEDYVNERYSNNDIRKKMKSIILMNFNGYNQLYIGKAFGLSQSYVSRVIKGFHKHLNDNRKLYLGE